MAAKKEYAIDLFELLNQADRKNYDYFDSLSDKEKQAFQPWTAMRFMSSSPNGFDAVSSLLTTNMVLNRDFSVISKDKEFFYRLMCVVGDGTRKKHHMQKPPKKKYGATALMNIFRSLTGEVYDDEELRILIRKNGFSASDIVDIAYSLDMDCKPKDIKKEIEVLYQDS